MQDPTHHQQLIIKDDHTQKQSLEMGVYEIYLLDMPHRIGIRR